ncbi:MAG: 4Fe-4S dicluster domain-containing protein [Victivallales bacterium]|nr:4Fe-4S dicluster domain-containing protein [Victivallales bacterium]
MKRKIVEIDAMKCNGCGLCAKACHEGAIAMVDGKARLVKDDYCDGMGDCLPACPTGAITITEREAAAYDEKAVAKRKAESQPKPAAAPHICPGKMARMITRETENSTLQLGTPTPTLTSQLRQWPVQIKLVPVKAPWFDGAKLLVAADCTAYAYANFHQELMRGRITIIGCPKLDEGDYTEKLTAILTQNEIKELVIVRMEVPCCGGLERAATNALKASGKFIPWRVVTVAIDGHLVE